MAYQKKQIMKLKIKLLAGFLLLCNTLMAQERSPTREASSLFSLPPFERAVRCIKFYEGFHQKRHYPYIGYGHRLLPGERLTWRLTEKQADSLLRSDLQQTLCFVSFLWQRFIAAGHAQLQCWPLQSFGQQLHTRKPANQEDKSRK